MPVAKDLQAQVGAHKVQVRVNLLEVLHKVQHSKTIHSKNRRIQNRWTQKTPQKAPIMAAVTPYATL
jgi:hypothetical protein